MIGDADPCGVKEEGGGQEEGLKAFSCSSWAAPLRWSYSLAVMCFLEAFVFGMMPLKLLFLSSSLSFIDS